MRIALSNGPKGQESTAQGLPWVNQKNALKGRRIEPSNNTHEKRINQDRSHSLNVVFAHLSIFPIKKRPRQ